MFLCPCHQDSALQDPLLPNAQDKPIKVSSLLSLSFFYLRFWSCIFDVHFSCQIIFLAKITVHICIDLQCYISMENLNESKGKIKLFRSQITVMNKGLTFDFNSLFQILILNKCFWRRWWITESRHGFWGREINWFTWFHSHQLCWLWTKAWCCWSIFEKTKYFLCLYLLYVLIFLCWTN